MKPRHVVAIGQVLDVFLRPLGLWTVINSHQTRCPFHRLHVRRIDHRRDWTFHDLPAGQNATRTPAVNPPVNGL